MRKKWNIRRLVYFIIVLLIFIAVLSYLANNIIFAEQPAGLFEFSLVHFLGYLFFLLMPVEILFGYFLTLGHNTLILIFLAIATALFAQYIDYLTGSFFRHIAIEEFVGEKKFKRYNKIIQKWGGPAILTFNLFPLSSPILLLVAGIVQFDIKKAFLCSFIGLTLKYSFIAWML